MTARPSIRAATGGSSAPTVPGPESDERRAEAGLSPPARRAGRPPRLSREAVVDAAERIVGEDGIDALTMRRVATVLGVSPMAIYRHVADKDELLVALLDRSAARLPRPQPPAEPRERVLAACRTIHDGLIEYPWVIDVLARGDLIAPSILWAMEEIVGGLLAGGLDRDGAVDGYRAIWQFTVGSLIVQRGLDRLSQLDRAPYVMQVLTDADPVRFPALAALAPHWAAARERDAFELGLGPLVDGLLGRS